MAWPAAWRPYGINPCETIDAAVIRRESTKNAAERQAISTLFSRPNKKTGKDATQVGIESRGRIPFLVRVIAAPGGIVQQEWENGHSTFNRKPECSLFRTPFSEPFPGRAGAFGWKSAAYAKALFFSRYS